VKAFRKEEESRERRAMQKKKYAKIKNRQTSSIKNSNSTREKGKTISTITKGKRQTAGRVNSKGWEVGRRRSPTEKSTFTRRKKTNPLGGNSWWGRQYCHSRKGNLGR